MISNKPLHILLVQLYSNGDCLYATTVARQIKTDYPGCHLTWAISDFCQTIIDSNPFVDEKMVITEVPKNDVAAFRRLKRRFQAEKKAGKWDEIFVTMNMDDNQSLYDGTIRGMILRAYPHPVTVPVEPVLVLTDKETTRVSDFADQYHLREYANVILWEFAPQSGQALFSFDFVMELAQKMAELPSTCVILSSARNFKGSSRVIDASVLSLRENAALTHYCTLLLGSSSGITWISTSSAGKMLPMVQLLDPTTAFFNPPSVDFERNKIPAQLIEIVGINRSNLLGCVQEIVTGSFVTAKRKYHQMWPVHFSTTRKVVYNMMCYGQFSAISRHYKIMTSLYGKHPGLLNQFRKALLGFPLKLAGNIFRKKIMRNS